MTDSSGRNPGADGGEEVALGVLFHTTAVLDADRLNRIPQAAGVAITRSLVGVVDIALANANGIVPFTESVFGALVFRDASGARRRALLLERFPDTFRGVLTFRLRSVLELALEVALVGGEVPRAHGIVETGTLGLQEGTVNVAAESFGVPEASRRVVAGLLNLEGVLAAFFADLVVVGRNVAHVVCVAAILDLSPDQVGILDGGVGHTAFTAFLHSSAPHAEVVSVASVSVGVLERAADVTNGVGRVVVELAATGGVAFR